MFMAHETPAQSIAVCLAHREVFAHNTDRLARRGWSTTRRCARYILRRLMIDRMTVSAVARELGLSWDTVNTIAMDATQMIVATGTDRLDGVRVIGVDEHRWSHTRHSDGFVTVIIDLTPVLAGTGRARLLDMVPGRSAAALTSWLANQSPQFRDQIEVVAMDGFGGYKTAAAEQLPEATTVMDPFHVVALAGAKLDGCRQRVQQQTCGHRGRSGDPLYGARRTLRTRLPLLSTRQIPVDQRIRRRPPRGGRRDVERLPTHHRRLQPARPPPRQVDDDRPHQLPAAWCARRFGGTEPLGRTLWRRRADVLAFFDHHTSNGPTEAINGRLEALRRNALGFRNLTPTGCAHYCTAATSFNRSTHSKSGRAGLPVKPHIRFRPPLSVLKFGVIVSS